MKILEHVLCDVRGKKIVKMHHSIVCQSASATIPSTQGSVTAETKDNEFVVKSPIYHSSQFWNIHITIQDHEHVHDPAGNV